MSRCASSLRHITCRPRHKNKTTGPEVHLVMTDKAVSRLGFNRYPWCSYTEVGQHLGVQFVGLVVHLTHTIHLIHLLLLSTEQEHHTKCWPVHSIHKITTNLGVVDEHWLNL